MNKELKDAIESARFHAEKGIELPGDVALCMAADEIDRLRAEVQHLTEWMQQAGLPTIPVAMAPDGIARIRVENYKVERVGDRNLVWVDADEVRRLLPLTEEARRSDAGRVPERAAWLTIEEMANCVTTAFPNTSRLAALAFANVIAKASIAKGSHLSTSPKPATGAMVASDSWAARFLSLTTEERLFVLRCGVNGSGKYAASPSTGSDGRGLWDAPERLGLLVCVGSFAWDAPGFLEGIASLAGSPQPSADVVVPRDLFKQLRDNCEATLAESDISAFRKEYRAGLLQRADDALRSSTNHDAQDAGEGR